MLHNNRELFACCMHVFSPGTHVKFYTTLLECSRTTASWYQMNSCELIRGTQSPLLFREFDNLKSVVPLKMFFSISGNYAHYFPCICISVRYDCSFLRFLLRYDSLAFSSLLLIRRNDFFYFCRSLNNPLVFMTGINYFHFLSLFTGFSSSRFTINK